MRTHRPLALLAICGVLLLALPATARAQASFVRGDCNIDGGIDIGDPIYILAALFSGGPAPVCTDACDTNDDAGLDIADAVYALGFLFSSGPPPAAPYPGCGTDPTADALACASFSLCVPAVENCTNNVDDDGDSLIDCQDPDCAADPICIENCANGEDDDQDGLFDCQDPDCAGDPSCVEDCSNGFDDDGDSLIDCQDPDCAADPACVEDCSNGVDDDGDSLVDCQDPDCAADPACGEDCSNGVDDDGDGNVDCQDGDCVGQPACAALSHVVDIQPIWGDAAGTTGSCTFCHAGPAPFAGLSLEPGLAYPSIVDVPSGGCAGVDRIEPGDPSLSWVYRKITGTHTDPLLGCGAPVGNQMPPGAFCCLTPAEIALIEQWIIQGARLSTLVINEVDYDQVGADTSEYIEIHNSGGSPHPLADLRLVLVNGATSLQYTVVDLSTAGPAIPAGGYLVVHSPTVTIFPGALSVQVNPQDNVQNGAPDAIALVDIATLTLLDALSYEGAVTAATITGFPGTVNLVEGTATPVADDNVTTGLVLIRSPNGTDTDNAIADWSTTTLPTPGIANP